MRFLLRLAFWLGVILVLLPSGGSAPSGQSEPVNPIDAVWAAKSTVSDMRAFCDRQPDACTVGSQTAVALGHRAQAGAKMLYEFLNDQFGAAETVGATPAAATGSIRTIPLPTARPSQHTLTPRDMAPPWRGPPPQPRNDRPA